jgi:hypothetical protein
MIYVSLWTLPSHVPGLLRVIVADVAEWDDYVSRVIEQGVKVE